MKFTKLLLAMSLFLGAAGMMTGCDDDDDDDNNNPMGGGNTYATVVEALAADSNYSSLVAAVTKAGLASTLSSGSANYTVFAPDNAAFAALLSAIGATSLDDVTAEQLSPILLYHVLGTTVDATAAVAAATANQSVNALGGTPSLALNGANIEIDGTATVTDPDYEVTDNGIVHGISAVLLPSIADVVVSNDDFSSLEAALVATESDAGFVATLDGAGSFTVFAPNDAAFAALVGALSASSSTGITGLGDFASYQLVPVLAYHVAASQILSGDVVNGTAPTLGGTVATSTGSGVMIDGATVVTADLLTRNGVIHVIDSVLLPSITDIVVTQPEFEQLKNTVLAADGGAGTPDIAPTLDADGTFTLFAPSNAAFLALSAAPSGQALTNVLLYHVLAEASPIYAADALGLASPTAFNTALGSLPEYQLTVTGGSGVSLQDAGSSEVSNVEVVNYFAANGVIHVVSKVLLPGAPD